MVAKGWEERKIGIYCLMDTEVQFGKVKIFWKWTVVVSENGQTTVLNLLNAIDIYSSNMIKMVNSVTYILSQLKKSILQCLFIVNVTCQWQWQEDTYFKSLSYNVRVDKSTTNHISPFKVFLKVFLLWFKIHLLWRNYFLNVSLFHSSMLTKVTTLVI